MCSVNPQGTSQWPPANHWRLPPADSVQIHCQAQVPHVSDPQTDHLANRPVDTQSSKSPLHHQAPTMLLNAQAAKSEVEHFSWNPPSSAEFTLNKHTWDALLQTRKKRAFSDNSWTNCIIEGLKQSNPYCSFKFNTHRLKVADSRKKAGLHFACNGRCMFTGCSVVFRIAVQSIDTLLAKVNYTGLVNHLANELRSRPVRGRARHELRAELSHKPSIRHHLESLAQLPEDIYISQEIAMRCQFHIPYGRLHVKAGTVIIVIRKCL